MSSGTMFGKPQGKWMVGSIAPHGAETALSGKIIGECPMVNYPSLSVRVPERVGLVDNPLVILLVLAGLYYVIKK